MDKLSKSKILCTFSGKNGDILWSLPTAKAIADREGTAVDFAIMPYYATLLPLIRFQSYISNAFSVQDWECQHSHFGDQPWQPPAHVSNGYEQVYHLGYRNDPHYGRKRALIDFIADQQAVTLDNPIPFLRTPEYKGEPHFAYAFNFTQYDNKMKFIDEISKSVGLKWININDLPWLEGAACIKSAVAFIGCRSANNVIAHGVGQQNIFIYEPDPGRLSEVFGCPYGPQETIVPLSNAVGAFTQRAMLWKIAEEEKRQPPRKVSLGNRPLISALHPDDYKDIAEGINIVKDATNYLKGQGAKIEVPIEQRWWEYGTLVQVLLAKYDGRIPESISVLDVGSGWSALGPALNLKYNCDVIEYEPGQTYLNDRLQTTRILNNAGRKGIYSHAFSLNAMPGQDYDVVCCTSVLEHVSKDIEKQCWKELANRVRKNGILFITVDVVENAHESYTMDNLRVQPNFTLQDMQERVQMLRDECGMKVLGEAEFIWNGANVYDYNFFRVVLTK